MSFLDTSREGNPRFETTREFEPTPLELARSCALPLPLQLPSQTMAWTCSALSNEGLVANLHREGLIKHTRYESRPFDWAPADLLLALAELGRRSRLLTAPTLFSLDFTLTRTHLSLLVSSSFSSRSCAKLTPFSRVQRHRQRAAYARTRCREPPTSAQAWRQRP